MLYLVDKVVTGNEYFLKKSTVMEDIGDSKELEDDSFTSTGMYTSSKGVELLKPSVKR